MNNFTEGTLSNLIFDFQRSNYALNMLKDKVTEKFNYIDKNLTYDDLQVYFISLVRETMKYYNDMLSIIDLKKIFLLFLVMAKDLNLKRIKNILMKYKDMFI